MASLYPLPNHSDADNRYNYVYSALEPTNRFEVKARTGLEHQHETKAYVRIAHDTEDVESPRGVWGGGGQVKLPTPGESHNRGRSYSANVVQVLNPSLTTRVARDLQSSHARQRIPRPVRVSQGCARRRLRRVLSRPESLMFRSGIATAGAGAQLGDFGAFERRHIRSHRRAALRQQADESPWRARAEVRRQRGAAAEAAELLQQRGRRHGVRAVHAWRHGQPDWRSAGRPAVAVSSRVRGSKDGRFRMWNLDAVCAGQLEDSSQPDARYRRPRRVLDQQRRAERPRHVVRSRPCTIRLAARFSIPAAHAVERRSLRGAGPGARLACFRTARHLRFLASTWRGISAATAQACFAAGTGCS